MRLLVLAMLGCGGCAVPTTVYVDVRTVPGWLVDPLNEAAALWADHYITVAPSHDGIRFETFHAAWPWGSYEYRDGEPSVIHINDRLDVANDPPAKYATCVVMHELGHAIGLHHVRDANPDDPSLMRQWMAVPVGDDQRECFWSANDETEVERVLRGEPPDPQPLTYGETTP